MRVRSRHDHEHSSASGKSTGRLEAFSDGVFAIAITLLALNLHVPELTTATPHALAVALAKMWPAYLSFLLSFLTLLIAWVYHHRLLDGARHAGTRLLFLNGVLLLAVSLVPFPTALLSDYLRSPAASMACAAYAGYIGVLNLTYNLLWWEVVRQQTGHGDVFRIFYELLSEKVTRRECHAPGRGWDPPTSLLLSFIGFPCYLVAIGLAFWTPIATLLICGALWVVWTLRAPELEAES